MPENPLGDGGAESHVLCCRVSEQDRLANYVGSLTTKDR